MEVEVNNFLSETHHQLPLRQYKKVKGKYFLVFLLLMLIVVYHFFEQEQCNFMISIQTQQNFQLTMYHRIIYFRRKFIIFSLRKIYNSRVLDKIFERKNSKLFFEESF